MYKWMVLTLIFSPICLLSSSAVIESRLDVWNNVILTQRTVLLCRIRLTCSVGLYDLSFRARVLHAHLATAISTGRGVSDPIAKTPTVCSHLLCPTSSSNSAASLVCDVRFRPQTVTDLWLIVGDHNRRVNVMQGPVQVSPCYDWHSVHDLPGYRSWDLTFPKVLFYLLCFTNRPIITTVNRIFHSQLSL